MKQHLLLLAEIFKGQNVAGYWMSEKLDGVRAWWDGGVSRGMNCREIPYANTAKHDRFLVEPKATGLWSRYGQPIQAPDWFLDDLPGYPCDGELWMGRQKFQQTVSIVQAKVSARDWTGIEYVIFDFPSPFKLLAPRKISVPTATFEIKAEAFDWANARAPTGWLRGSAQSVGDVVDRALNSKVARVIGMRQLSTNPIVADREVSEALTETLAAGGEGLMLRANSQPWEPVRAKGLLKVKPTLDAEAEILGYRFAKEGKIAGKMGALVCVMLDDGKPNGRIFQMSGFTDAERELSAVNPEDARFAEEYARDAYGEEVPQQMTNLNFPRGSIVTYKYRELTDKKLPKDPRFYRRLNG